MRWSLHACETEAPPATLAYTNWRGETRPRTLQPQYAWYGATRWHTDPQWLLRAVDCEDGTTKDFALAGFVRPAADRTRELESAVREAADLLATVFGYHSETARRLRALANGRAVR